MKKIMLSLFTIAAVAVMATGATSAYFSDSEIVHGNEFSTGTVQIGSTYALPIHVSGLYPGAVKTSAPLAIAYTGSLKGDLYFGFQHASGGAVLGDELDFQVARVNDNGDVLSYVYPGFVHADQPYTQWTELAAGLNTNDVVRYVVYVRMDSDAANTLQNQTALSDIVLYAVQEGATPTGQPVSFVPGA